MLRPEEKRAYTVGKKKESVVMDRGEGKKPSGEEKGNDGHSWSERRFRVGYWKSRRERKNRGECYVVLPLDAILP